MAAMRLGCLFSHPANMAYLHKAQSPYSVNTLAVLAAQAAVRGTTYIRNYVAEVLAARELLSVGLERLGISVRTELGEIRADADSASARSKCGTICASRAILVRDRSYEVPGLRARDRRDARADAAISWRQLEEIWKA